MRISSNALELIMTLRDLIGQDEANPSMSLSKELAALPDFEGSRATAGYYVTPEGDITDDHWWIVMDDDSVLDGMQDEPVRCSKKDPRFSRYFPYDGEMGLPVELLQLADHMKSQHRYGERKSFGEMLGEVSGAAPASDVSRQGPEALPDDMTADGREGVPAEGFDDETRPEDMQMGWEDLLDEDPTQEKPVTMQDLAVLKTYFDRLFAKLGVDIVFTKHFIDRVNDPRNGKQITPAELVRMFKQQRQRNGKRIASMGDEAAAVLRDMATDINVPFVLIWDERTQMLDLIAKTVMRKPDFRTSTEVIAVEDSSKNGLFGPIYHVTQSDISSFADFDMTAASKSAVLGPAIYATFGDGAEWRPTGSRNANVLEGYVRGSIIDLTRPLTKAEINPIEELLGRELEVVPFMTLEKRFGSIANGLKQAGYSAAIHMGPGATGKHIAVFVLNDIIDSDSLNEVDHPEFMPGGDETHGDNGHDPTYDQRASQVNTGWPAP